MLGRRDARTSGLGPSLGPVKAPLSNAAGLGSRGRWEVCWNEFKFAARIRESYLCYGGKCVGLS